MNILYARGDGIIFKNLLELLKKNIRNGCIVFGPTGMSFKMTDTHKKALIVWEILGENLPVYEFTAPAPLSIGVSLARLHGDIKNIKTKDQVAFIIEDKNESELFVECIPKEKTHVPRSRIKIQDLHVVDIEVPTGYAQPLMTVPGKDFIKILKDVMVVKGSTHVELTHYPKLITLTAKFNDVYDRVVPYGSGGAQSKILGQTFETPQFAHIQKLGNLGTKIQFFGGPGLPLLLRTNLGEYGQINIFIKDVTQFSLEPPAVE